MKTTPTDIIILHKCTKNYGQMMYGFWDMVQDRWTDRQKEWHVEVGALPKNLIEPMLVGHMVRLHEKTCQVAMTDYF